MRKRSKYRPKGVVLDVMTYVKSGIQTVASVPEVAKQIKTMAAEINRRIPIPT